MTLVLFSCLQVTAINAAGLTTTVNGLPITVDKSL
jgi:hypothetical protein